MRWGSRREWTSAGRWRRIPGGPLSLRELARALGTEAALRSPLLRSVVAACGGEPVSRAAWRAWLRAGGLAMVLRRRAARAKRRARST